MEKDQVFSLDFCFLLFCCTNYSYMNLQLTQEGIESNLGPRNCAIKKAVQASHHQGNFKYEESAEMQCTSNAYISIVFSVIKKINLWKSLDLDCLLEQGNRIFKLVGVLATS